MRFEKTEVFNFKGACRGLRNPLESWKRSDSFIEKDYEGQLELGKNDLELMQRLIKAGSEHRKFMRQIFISVDITAPLYWWKEFDTYKVGTVANSTSTMHKLATTPITPDCFELDDKALELNEDVWTCWDILDEFIRCYLEPLRQMYLATKHKDYWKALVQCLPESWLQTRTVTMNYENLLNMCSKGQRRFHKLTEWSVDFINWAKSLPYADELLFME